MNKLFGKTIYTYTRAQALEDGLLVDASSLARQAGIKWPVALTSAVWEDCVHWTDEIGKHRKIYQDQTGRLWDVLVMAGHAIRSSPNGATTLLFQLDRVPRNGRARRSQTVTLKAIAGPGDQGEPVITIMMPEET